MIVSLYRTHSEQVTVGTLEGVGPAYLHSLLKALIAWRKRRRDPDRRVWVGISQLPEAEFQTAWEAMDPLAFERTVLDYRPPEASIVPPTSPALFLEEDRLRVRIEIWRAEKPSRADVRRQLAPLLKRHRATCEVSIRKEEEFGPGKDPGFYLTVDIDRWPPEGATVASAWKLGDEARALLLAKKGDELTRPVALNLLRAGRWELFRGQPESEWLDVKGAPYTGHKEIWKHELARDVAAFANSPHGGVIVIGMTTKQENDIEEIEKVRELELSRVVPSTYRRVIERWVYPEVSGLEIERIEGKTPGRGIVLLVVPPQPEGSRPFLVWQAMVAGKLYEHSILLPFRRADETAFGDIGGVHARLRLGEQVIAGKRRIS